MNSSKPKIKSELHPRNRHRHGYDFDILTEHVSALSQYVSLNKYGNSSIDFFNPEAVKLLNRALLLVHYDMLYWDIPHGFLCPPVPGRADYVHLVADLISESNRKKIPIGSKVNCLDIGVGANCIYPIIGSQQYGWSFVGSEIEEEALNSAELIIDRNEQLKDKLEIRKQDDVKSIFEGIIKEEELFDAVICNPPFYSSAAEAIKANKRKNRNLKAKKSGTNKSNKWSQNFGGKSNELWCEGGEVSFISKMIKESARYSRQVLWFTSLVSNQDHLDLLEKTLTDVEIAEYKVISMATGNKKSRILAWTFFNKKRRNIWCLTRFSK